MSDIYIGIMSGTSLDAIDATACRFDNQKVEILGFHSKPWRIELRAILFELATIATVNMDILVRTHFDLATEYATAVSELLSSLPLPSSGIRAIGLHGQTVRHLPRHATLQLGSGPALAVLTGIDVISDFRAADIAAGGQGAPFVPMFDYRFLRSDTVSRLVVNIGGISNVTWIPRSAKPEELVAFDTGPGNMLIDAIAERYLGEPFDRNGEHARKGNVDTALLNELLSHSYFQTAPPKSTGRELFGKNFLLPIVERIEKKSLALNDAFATLTELTARSITQCFNFVHKQEPLEIIVSGGGSRNVFLMERIAASANDARVVSSDVFGIPSNAKEAIAFAFFAKAFVEEIPIHLPLTTGATKRVVLGSLSRAAR